MRAAPVQRVALVVQFTQLGQRVADLQQGPSRVVAQSAEQVFGCRAQVKHRRARMQQLPVALAQHGAAPGGQHEVAGAGDQLGNDFSFDVPKGIFAVALEELLDAAADAQFDLMVRIDKRHADLACQLFADGGLATAGHADEGDLDLYLKHALPVP